MPTVPQDASALGRWVDACDLEVGDQLLLRDGRTLSILAVHEKPFRDMVYNVEVEDLHCYAVGNCGVLAHNQNGASVGGGSAGYGGSAPSNPSWTKARGDYWKSRAGQAAEGEFSPSNLERMGQGKPPLHDELGVPKELHHQIPQRDGGLHTPDNLQEVWPWEHADIDPFRHYNGPRPGD